jgi:hypothetical protein
MRIKMNWEEYRTREKLLSLEGQLLYELRNSTEWEDRDENKVLNDFDWQLFGLVTGLDKVEGCFNEVVYGKEEDGLYRLNFLYYVDGDIIYSSYFEFPKDVLFYSETVEEFFNNGISTVIDKLESIAPEVVDEIKDRFFRSLTVSDLTEPLYWEVVTDYLQKQLDMHKD